MCFMLKKIISGGQIGAEQAALDVALKLDIPHGGWIQKGRRTQNWSLPEKYKLKEMSTASYKKRIEQNVIDSDGTLIISHGELTGGSICSREMTLKHQRPLLHVDLNQINTIPAAKLINAWITLKPIEILNVTGSLASEDARIYKTTIEILESAYHLSPLENKALALDFVRDKRPTEVSSDPSDLPKTTADAVDQLIAKLSLRDRTIIADLPPDDLAPLNLSLGVHIRSQLLQEGVNKELLESCRPVSGNDRPDLDRAAFLIIEKLWEKLQKTHRLRVVK